MIWISNYISHATVGVCNYLYMPRSWLIYVRNKGTLGSFPTLFILVPRIIIHVWDGVVLSLVSAVFIWIVMLNKSHNAPIPHPTIHHFITVKCLRVHISVTKWCIVGYLSDALWDMWEGSIASFQRILTTANFGKLSWWASKFQLLE